MLEESELARKEEMDKLLDKVGRGRSRPPHLDSEGRKAPRKPQSLPSVFQISELEGNLQTLRNSNST